MHSSLKLAGTLAFAALLTLPLNSSIRAAKDKPTDARSVAAVGKKAPDFSLKDTEGNVHTLRQYLDSGKTVVVHWYNPKCPFIVRHFETYPTFATLYGDYHDKNVVFLAINSTGPSNPAYGMDAESKKKWSIQYPILLDPTGAVGKSFGAKTTPHTFVISSDGFIRYSGAIDNDPRDEKPTNKKLNYVRQALDEILAGKPVSVAETRPYGCSVKYGN